MSFKYKFIFSFVLLEIIFISLIVSVNFYTIKNSSNELIQERIESNITFLEELIKVPLSIFDLATLDNLVENSVKYVNSIVIIDKQNRIVSSAYNYKYTPIDELVDLKKNKEINFNDQNYSIRYKKIYEEDTYLGDMYIIFDLSNINQVIDNNKRNTFFIILLEIIISSFLSYLIGINLTKKLGHLSSIAIRIGKEENIKIPYKNSNDEIGTLSKAMSKMQIDLVSRSLVIKQSNELLKKQKDDLILANQTKDDFLANMSHELKTPLNSINLISSIMKRDKTDRYNEKDLKNIEVINNCGNFLLSLVNDVLDISKLKQKKMSLSQTEIDIKQLIDEVKDIFYSQIKEKGLGLKLDLDNSIKIIYGDKIKILQILKNLVSNALKFSENGDITIKVKDEEQNICISIHDQGIGIPHDKLPDIFERFKQVDTSTTRQHAGTGLGLAICKELIELMNGSIFVKSEVNEGTTFYLTLPKNQTIIKSLDLLEIKETIKTSEEINQTFKEIIQTSEEIKETFKNERKNIEVLNIKNDKKVLIYNTNIIDFFRIVIEIKKTYSVNQVYSLDELLNKENLIFDTVIIDADTISSDILNKIVTFFGNKLIILTSNNSIQSNEITIEVKKPIDINKLIEKL